MGDGVCAKYIAELLARSGPTRMCASQRRGQEVVEEQ